MYSEFFIIKTLISFEPSEIVSISLGDSVDNLKALINDVIELKETNNVIRANLGLAYKVKDLILYIKRNESYLKDDELMSYCDTLLNYIEDVIKQTEDEKEYYFFTWSTSESKKRGFADTLFFGLSTSDVFNHCTKDADILDLFVSNPKFLEAVNIKYVLSTMNKIIICYPELVDDLNLRDKFKNYLDKNFYNVPFKYKNYYLGTVSRLEGLKINKDKQRVRINEE